MVLEAARIGVGLAVLALLAYWTIRRLSGDGDDPTLRWSGSSETGSTTMLISGVHAVAVVAGIGILAFMPEVMAGGLSALVVAAFIAVVAAHWVIEKREVS